MLVLIIESVIIVISVPVSVWMYIKYRGIKDQMQLMKIKVNQMAIYIKQLENNNELLK